MTTYATTCTNGTYCSKRPCNGFSPCYGAREIVVIIVVHRARASGAPGYRTEARESSRIASSSSFDIARVTKENTHGAEFYKIQLTKSLINAKERKRRKTNTNFRGVDKVGAW